MKTQGEGLDFDPGQYRLESHALTLRISQAAIVLDCAICGTNHFGFTAVQAVRNIVWHFASPDAEHRCPVAVTLVAYASKSAICAESMDVNVLVAAALDLLDRYEDPACWEQLRDFYNELAMRLVHHRQSIPYSRFLAIAA